MNWDWNDRNAWILFAAHFTGTAKAAHADAMMDLLHDRFPPEPQFVPANNSLKDQLCARIASMSEEQIGALYLAIHAIETDAAWHDPDAQPKSGMK